MMVRLLSGCRHSAPAALAAALLAACAGPAPREPDATPSPGPPTRPAQPQRDYLSLRNQGQAQEVVLYALGLLDTGYRFGGRNPEAGLDCSGMVSYVVEQVSGLRLPHNAAAIARLTRPVPRSALQAGDLVFFNTSGRSHSHMGIYLGDDRFVHAPSSRGKVRVDRLSAKYYAERFEGGRSLQPTAGALAESQ